MNQHPTISVIIPVYNAECYLHRCLDSLTNQTYKNIEVLLVNDGSYDQSEDICKKYESRDSRFRLINKTNGGVSSARNLGLQSAKGEWIYFLDADDWLEFDIFEKLLTEGKDYDYIRHSFVNILKQNSNQKNIFHIDIPKSRNEYLQQIITRKTSLSVWGALYNSKLVKDIIFDENISCGEDWIFLTQYILRVNEIKVITEPLYIYNRINENSCTNVFSRRKYKDTLFSLDKIFHIVPESSHKLKQIALYDIVYHFLFSLLKPNKNKLNSDDYKYIIQNKNISTRQLLSTHIELKKKIFLLLGIHKTTFKLLHKLYSLKHRK